MAYEFDVSELSSNKPPRTAQRREAFYRISNGKDRCNADGRPCVIIKLPEDASRDDAEKLARKIEETIKVDAYAAVREAERDGQWLLNEKRGSGKKR